VGVVRIGLFPVVKPIAILSFFLVIVRTIILDILQASASIILTIPTVFAFAAGKELLSSWLNILGADGSVQEAKIRLNYTIVFVIDYSNRVF